MLNFFLYSIFPFQLQSVMYALDFKDTGLICKRDSFGKAFIKWTF